MLGKSLKEMKEASGMTFQQIADKSGVPLSTVNRIMTGGTDQPAYQTVAEIVKAMNGSLDELSGISVPENPASDTAENHVEKHCVKCCMDIAKSERAHYDAKIVEVRRQYNALLKSKTRWLIAVFSVAVLFACIDIIMLAEKVL